MGWARYTSFRTQYVSLPWQFATAHFATHVSSLPDKIFTKENAINTAKEKVCTMDFSNLPKE